MTSYRWDKRREKKLNRKRIAGITVFDAVLLFLIFCLGLWFYYMLTFTTLIPAYCMEQMANLGATATTISILKSAYYLSLALFVFWCVQLFSNRKGASSWGRFIWDSFIGFSIFLIVILYSNVNLWDKVGQPDGTLAIGKGIWTIDDAGLREWKKLPLIRIDPKISGDRILYHAEYRHPQCVWLGENKITVDKDTTTYKSLEDYHAQNLPGQFKNPKFISPWKPDSFVINFFSAFRFRNDNAVARAKANQDYRPLTAEERARFIRKQECLRTVYERHKEFFARRKDVEEHCDPSWSHEESPDLVLD